MIKKLGMAWLVIKWCVLCPRAGSTFIDYDEAAKRWVVRHEPTKD
jgi:hypothetical protein